MMVPVGSNDQPTRIARAATVLEVTSGSARAVVRPNHPVVIGRDASCDLVVDGNLVSRRHAEVDVAADGWVLRDLDSRNGTFVDGQRAVYVAVTDGGDVHLGSVDGPAVHFEVIEEEVEVDDAAVPEQVAEPDPAVLAAAQSVAPALAARTPTAAHEAGERLRIGRGADNDIVLADMLASRNHAELHRTAEGYEVVDLGSRNGTFHNGQQVARAALRPGDMVSIGRHEFVFDGQRLHQFEDTGPVSLIADDLTVTVKNTQLIDDISFALPEGSLLAVIGPSGCGKSTLLRAVTGLRPATQGRVRYDGRDLYADYAELRYRIGLVPQDDVLHRQLTVQRALRFAAALRFADDVPRKERSQRVSEVLETLNLTERAKQRIDTLSGGQRKRVSVALELLTEPSLLFLDEPTSGLDPALDKEVMQELRELADRGRTVIVVTHNVLHLDLCDRVLVMCAGGRMGYFGPPDELLDFFGAQDYAEVFSMITDDPNKWASKYRTSEHYTRYVTAQVAGLAPAQHIAPAMPALPGAQPTAAPPAPATPAGPSELHQASTSKVRPGQRLTPSAAAPSSATQLPAGPAKPANLGPPAPVSPAPAPITGAPTTGAATGPQPTQAIPVSPPAPTILPPGAPPPGAPPAPDRVVGRAKVKLGGGLGSAALHPSAPIRQFLTLCLRMFWVIGADRGYSLFLLGLPCALAILVHTVPGDNGLAAPQLLRFNLEAERLLVVLVVGAAFLGTAAAIREIVNEATIYKRERAVGLSAGAYVASKVVVFSIIIWVQAALFTWLSLIGKQRPGAPLVFKNYPLVEITIPVAFVALASMAIGLLVSTLARTTEQTTPVLVVLVMAQLVLCGGLFELDGQVVMEQVSWLFPTRWGLAAGASTVDLQTMIPVKDPLWTHSLGAWWRSIVLLLLQFAVFIGATRLALRRLEPGRE
jgi:ABC-type multidrug transport system ATPase subunit/pSer/pThr/pTyr-binding forkhead associated (FHA) protein